MWLTLNVIPTLGYATESYAISMTPSYTWQHKWSMMNDWELSLSGYRKPEWCSTRNVSFLSILLNSWDIFSMNKASVQTRPKLKLYAVSQSHRKSTTSNASWEWSTKWQSLYQPGQSQWTTATTPKERTCGNGIKPYSSHLKESRMNWHLQQPCPLQPKLSYSHLKRCL